MTRTSLSRRLFALLVPALFVCAIPATPADASAISDKYAQLGGSSSFLGSPTISESSTPDGIGRYRHYQHGSIYWSPGTGAHEVHGLIRDKWAGLGWEQSYLGYPMTDEIDTFDAAGRVSKFQGGELIWRKATNAVSEVRSSDLVIDLPVPAGEAWKVSQANAVNSGDSHGNAWVYCFDFIRSEGWAQSNGRPFVAAANTEILYVEDGLGPGEKPGNVIIQRLGEGRYASYLHNKKGTYTAHFGAGALLLPQYTPAAWPRPKSGTVLAEVGNTGTGLDAYHLHFCITTSPDRGALFAPFESVPVAFQNYSYSTDGGGSWHAVATGVPRRDQWVRREAPKPGQTSPKVNPTPTINYGTVTGQVTLGAGTGKPSGAGSLTVGVVSAWGETLRTAKISVPGGVLNGPWLFKIANVPAYNNLTLGVAYSGPWSVATGGGLVGGQSAKFDLAPNGTATKNVQIKATLLK